MTPRVRWLILGLALAGLAFATASTRVHYRLLTEPNYTSPCDLNTTFSCTQAYLSRFGAIRGVPVALGGVTWFALVALIAAWARPTTEGPPSPAGSYVFALATAGLGVVLYLAYASYMVLKVVCLLCLGTYVSVVGLFVVSGLATSTPMTRLPIRLLRDLRSVATRPLLLVVALLYLGGTAAAVVLFPREMKAQTAVPAPPPQDEQQRFAVAWAQQPRTDLGIPAGGAKVVIVKFNDWLCSACRDWAKWYQPVLDKYEQQAPGAVKLVIKDWPWDTSCNFVMPPPTFRGHEGSCQAAAAVRMARDRGKDAAMEAWLFDNQQHLNEVNLKDKSAAQLIRAQARLLLGVTDFDREYNAKVADIRRDVADGGAVRIESTPVFFVNGVRTTVAQAGPQMGQNLPPEYVDMAIKIELAKSGGKE
jgi:uncharacterized membrane protein/protein-disulfide isomerase